VIDSGELGALLTNEMDPETLPLVVGANTALNVALLPAPMLIGSAGIPLMLKPLPVTLACEIETAAVPPLVK